MEITELLRDATDNVKQILDIESVIGKPIINAGVIVIPITRMSVGFASAGGELEGKLPKNLKELPVGGLGGGANIQPLGFLVIENNSVRFINIGDTRGVNSWEKLIDVVLNAMSD